MKPLVPWKMLAHRDPLAQGTLHNRARRELIVGSTSDANPEARERQHTLRNCAQLVDMIHEETRVTESDC